MSLSRLFYIALILFLIPIILGKVDASSLWQLLKNPSQLSDLRVLKLVFGDLVKDVIGYYRNLVVSWLGGTIKKQFQEREIEIKIK